MRASPLAFSALVGQESMKQALLLNAIDPAIGGVLIRGQKGTAKSTAVRALAALLPDISVVRGCRFNCHPQDVRHRCFECAERLVQGELLQPEQRRMRVVELPINASEDRVVGTIDIEAAIRTGARRFEAGVLGAANRNILYVDEVNLLDDHLVDVLLDAAAMGLNVVEREGISVTHPSRFILVGTMNPEEGELRPQLLDRFGLCVDVRGLRSVEERVLVMEREHAGSHPGDESAQDAALGAVISRAVAGRAAVELSAPMRQLAALICTDAGAAGHRADIVVCRTARALRALREAQRPGPAAHARSQVTPDDVVRAAALALAHRARERRDGSGGAEQIAEQARQRAEAAQQAASEDSVAAAAEMAPEPLGAEDSTAEGESGEASAQGQQSESPRAQDASPSAPHVEFDGTTFSVRRLQLPRDRRTRRTPGKRSLTRSGDRRGRYVRSAITEKTTDLALDATLRAAAPHQSKRRATARSAGHPPSQALHLERQDLRQKVRQRRTGTLIVFVVDASASMDAEQRMVATKGAVLSLLRDAYVRRDKVSLVVFSGRTARIVLRPTSSVDLAEQRLQKLSVGGTTPLTHGLVAGLQLIRTERLRDPTVYPLLVLISDGRGNISLFGEEPLLEAQRAAEQIRAEGVRCLVIDSARDYTKAQLPLPGAGGMPRTPLFGGYGFNACLDLADRLGGRYFGLYDLSQGEIVRTVEESLRGA